MEIRGSHNCTGRFAILNSFDADKVNSLLDYIVLEPTSEDDEKRAFKYEANLSF